MPTFCLICGCDELEAGRMHCFPANPEKSKRWQESLGIKHDPPLCLRNYRICCQHFLPECYKDMIPWRLRPDAVPTLHAPFIKR